MNGLREVVMRRPLHEHRFSARAVSALRKVRARTRLIFGAAVLGILELSRLWIGPQGARHTREAGRP